MRRIARVTEDLGRDGGGFYVEPPDIPEGLTCQDWRRRRMEVRQTEPSPRPRATFSWPELRPRMPLRPALAESAP
jgi:hypothetical protein